MKYEDYTMPTERTYWWRLLGVNDDWHPRRAASLEYNKIGRFDMPAGATGLQIKTPAGELFEWRWMPKTASAPQKFERVDPQGKHWWD